MYLKRAIIKNSGPLRSVDIELGFNSKGDPKPIVLVGSNGGGKTNFLSLVTDAIFEAAAVHYSNVLPTKGTGRSWFRIVGGRTTTIGTSGGVSLLKFEHEQESLVFIEKAGYYTTQEAANYLEKDILGAVSWPDEGSYKHFDVSDMTSERIFDTGVYAYFPTSRSELPYWMNRESIPDIEVDVFTHLAKELRRPIYIEKGVHQFKQWIMSVILESRSHFSQIGGPLSPVLPIGDVQSAIHARTTLENCNIILRQILDDKQARFVWLGRKSADKIAVAKGDDLMLPNLDALSGGQSILLAIFGTLLRYADQTQPGSGLDLSMVEGICIVDEIDSHIHVDLQHDVLPSLIGKFPRIQFILSSHSPLFPIGMRRVFGDAGFQIVEMPLGNNVTAENYSEFERAMGALTLTEAFNQRLLEQSIKEDVPLIFTEGETDAPYLERAANILGRSSLLNRCEIQWVGAKDAFGQGFNTGKNALDHTLSVLRANPKLTNRRILLLYDNDTKKTVADYGAISVRIMPTNVNNKKVKVGIENLLSENFITDDDYDVDNQLKDNGEHHIRKYLKKMEICKRACGSGKLEDFLPFSAALDLIEEYLDAK